MHGVGRSIGRWGVAALWVTLPFTAAPALADALDTSSDRVRDVVAVAAWVVWAGVLLAALIPRTVTLTGVRIAVPAAAAAMVWAAVAAPSVGATQVVALVVTLATAIVALAPQTADAFVDGSSYGHERRMALRAPGVLLLGPIELTWVAVVTGAVLGPLLLASGAWLAGAVAVVVGWPVAALGTRALHALARRWLVFTEAGVVVVDHLTLADTLLATRRVLASLGPAPADSTAHDLTAGALGLALELRFTTPQPITPIEGGRRPSRRETSRVDAVLVSPSLPGAVLAEAGRRRLPVQQASPPPTTSSPT